MRQKIFCARGLQTGPFAAPCTFQGHLWAFAKSAHASLLHSFFIAALSATLFLWRFCAFSLPVAQVLPSNRRGVTSQKSSLGDSFSRRNSLCTVESVKWRIPKRLILGYVRWPPPRLCSLLRSSTESTRFSSNLHMS